MCALMVNADDWGAASATTEAILRCFQVGALSAGSAMVYMADSARAAECAAEHGLPVGLHLNLSQRFDGSRVPEGVRRRQARVTRRFRYMRRARWLYDPRGQGELDDAIADQLDEFQRLYGSPPTRLDGHLHVHLCPNVLLSGALPRGIWMRPARTSATHGSTLGLAALRRARNGWLRRRFATSDHFFAIERIHPAIGGAGLDRVLDLAGRSNVEVMTHPARASELELMLEGPWLGDLEGHPLSSFGAAGRTKGR